MRMDVFVVLKEDGGNVVVAASDYADKLPVYGITKARKALKDAMSELGGRIVKAHLEFELEDALCVEDLATKFLEGKERMA